MAKSRNKRSAAGGKAAEQADKSFVRRNRQVIVFFVIFALLVGVSFIAIECYGSIPLLEKYVMLPSCKATAWSTSIALNLFGYQTGHHGTTITSRQLPIDIIPKCTPVPAFLIYASAVFAFPCRWRQKLIGLGIGILSIPVINLVRVMSLYVIGLHWREHFEGIHLYVWQPLVVFISLLVWVWWVEQFVSRTER